MLCILYHNKKTNYKILDAQGNKNKPSCLEGYKFGRLSQTRENIMVCMFLLPNIPMPTSPKYMFIMFLCSTIPMNYTLIK